MGQAPKLDGLLSVGQSLDPKTKITKRKTTEIASAASAFQKDVKKICKRNK